MRALKANARLLAERYPALGHALIGDLVAQARRTGYGFNRGLLFPGKPLPYGFPGGLGIAARNGQGPLISACRWRPSKAACRPAGCLFWWTCSGARWDCWKRG